MDLRQALAVKQWDGRRWVTLWRRPEMHDPHVPDEFTLFPECPKCGFSETWFVYVPHRNFISGGDGKFVETMVLDEDSLECFKVTCEKCGYQWLMETMESQELRR